MSKQQIGVVGMAVMGRNLALNIESRGYTVSVFNRSREKTEEVIAENPGKKLVPHYTVKEFVESLETPRRILLMVKAGAGTDSAIDSLKPYLDKGDIIIDGGNTFFQDTIRRNRELSAEGFNFIGTGVSGGEEGALKGPLSCLVVRKKLMNWLRRSLNRSLLVQKMANRVLPISVLMVLVIMSRWFTTALNTATCSHC